MPEKLRPLRVVETRLRLPADVAGIEGRSRIIESAIERIQTEYASLDNAFDFNLQFHLSAGEFEGREVLDI